MRPFCWPEAFKEIVHIMLHTKVIALGTNARKEKRGRPRYSYVDKLRDNTSFEKKTFNGEDAKQKGVEKSCSICPSK